MLNISPKYSIVVRLSPQEVETRIKSIIENHADKSIIEQQLDYAVNFRFAGFVRAGKFMLYRYPPTPIFELRDKPFNELSILNGTINSTQEGSIIRFEVKPDTIYKRLFYAMLVISALILARGINQRAINIQIISIFPPVIYLLIVNSIVCLFYLKAKNVFNKLFSNALKSQ